MGWDITLLCGIAICQGLTGYWAFHLSTNHGYARWGFGGVTLLGIILIVGSGVRANHSSSHIEESIGDIKKSGNTQQSSLTSVQAKLDAQSRQLSAVQQENTNLSIQNGQLLSQNAALGADIKKIAGAVNLKPAPGQSPNAMASEIIRHLATIDQRLHKVEYPPREQTTLYLGGLAVGRVAGVTQTGNDVSVQALTSTTPMDFSKTYFLQWAALKCESKTEDGYVAFGAETHHQYRNLKCRVVGRAPD